MQLRFIYLLVTFLCLRLFSCYFSHLLFSDHYLVYVVLDMKLPKLPPTFITTRSFKNYTADQLSSDIAQVSWATVELMDSVDDRVNAFKDLF